jgi:hypothetical protein
VTARANVRGWPVEFSGGAWIYSDTGEPISVERPCVLCGEMPTSEGHDACLGTLPSVTSACCGHGAQRGFVVFEPAPAKPLSRCDSRTGHQPNDRSE